jgi:hypothetical protein
MPLNFRIAAAVSVLAILCSAPASATDAAGAQACHLTGVINLMGVSEVMDDCIENAGVSQAQFRTACESHFDGAKDLARQVGGSVSNDRLAWLPRCPAPSQGQCSGFGGVPITVHYYSRPGDELARLPEGCAALGGRYSSS